MPNVPSTIIFPTVSDPVKGDEVRSFFRSIGDWVRIVSRFLNQTPIIQVQATNVAVTPASGSVIVTFTLVQQDTAYQVAVETSWVTSVGITAKSATAFTVTFGTAAPAGSPTFSWALLRKAS